MHWCLLADCGVVERFSLHVFQNASGSPSQSVQFIGRCFANFASPAFSNLGADSSFALPCLLKRWVCRTCLPGDVFCGTSFKIFHLCKLCMRWRPAVGPVICWLISHHIASLPSWIQMQHLLAFGMELDWSLLLFWHLVAHHHHHYHLPSSPSCAALLVEEHETRDWVPQKAALAFQPREVAYRSVTYTLFTPGTQMQSVTMMSYTRWHQQMFTQSVNKLF